ncbi:serine/threonine protein phosphatase [Candidatus Kaistella beijingensis]|uniref:metallophosphoesterase n=1 Tax=Candidatus Kaistella beijingensis TaxID=2820270 RepID=UPI001CC4DF3F|nr:metallophosphoesterase [Candidatus Kaistella beijingensis]UBB89927.1 serine/threonine protein phosphatase [Candidatus Kaistella beijingensis]
MNLYVISDIHGLYYTFKELLNKIGFNKTDELIILGDYINRGKRSKEVVDFIMDLQSQNYFITLLKGNHEDMIFDSLELEDWTSGDPETLKSFGINHLKNLNNDYKNWFSKLKHFEEKQNTIFVHAGLNFRYDNPFEDNKSMMWIQDWYQTINYNWLSKRMIIHGHVPIEKDCIEKMSAEIDISRVLNIDNGSFLKNCKGFGNLCSFELNSRRLQFQGNID